MKWISKKMLSLTLATTLSVGTVLPVSSAAAEEPIATKIDSLQISKPEAVEPEWIVWVIRGAVLIYKALDTYEAIQESEVEDAVQQYYDLPTNWLGDVSEGEEIESFKLEGSDEYFHLTFGDCDSYGMTHILARHHPSYWTGIIKDQNSFFEPSTTFSNIESMIATVANYGDNEKTILEKGLSWTYGTAVVDGYYGGKLYRLVVNGGEVTTIYPYGWNEAEVE